MIPPQWSSVPDWMRIVAREVNPLLQSPGTLIGLQIITATGAGTYTPTVGTTCVVIEMVGAGGGGGGVASPTTDTAIASPGGGGAYILKRLTANFSGSYVVGAKGTGGSAGANNGIAGGNTTFTDTAGSPTTFTAGGGSQGLAGAASAVPCQGIRGVGGLPTNGDILVRGGNGSEGIATKTTQAFGGNGGSSRFSVGGGGGTITATGTSAAGGSASGHGGGGGGAVAQSTGAAAAGGDGADGMIIIWEYS